MASTQLIACSSLMHLNIASGWNTTRPASIDLSRAGRKVLLYQFEFASLHCATFEVAV